MIILDNLMMAPVRGVFGIFREIVKAAEKEREADAAHLRNALAAAYQQLEQGEISEEAFDAREVELLDQLEALESEHSEDARASEPEKAPVAVGAAHDEAPADVPTALH